MRRVLAFVVVAACTSARPPSPAPLEKKRSPLRMTNAGLGPITKATRVTLTSLRELLAPEGLSVKPELHSTLRFYVYRDTEKVSYVVGNDDGTIAYVYLLSPAISVEPHPNWTPGSRFYDDDMLAVCNVVWEDGSVCWRDGDYVAVGFTRKFDDLTTAHSRRVLQGEVISRVIWSPTPFRHEVNDAESELSPDGD